MPAKSKWAHQGRVFGAMACSLAVAAAQRPWPPQYKLRPDEPARLTAADVVGPDGLVYPDWRQAGVPGGIPDVPVRARIADFGGHADDDADDASALERAVAAVTARGGGAVQLDAGVYHLDRPVVVTADGVVIRGGGRSRTTLSFRYRLPEKPRFVSHEDGATIAPHDVIELRAEPAALGRIRFFVGATEVEGVPRPASMAKTFRLLITGEQLIAAAGTGEHRIEAVVPEENGESSHGERRVVAHLDVHVPLASYAAPGSLRFARHLKGLGALSFCGDGTTGARWPLAEDGARGARELVLAVEPELEPGDAIAVTAPATERWNALVRNHCRWGEYRVYYFQVQKVDGRRVTLNQPLRYGFPVADGSFARAIHPIRRCGVEGLTIVQTTTPWTCGVFFCDAWECWLRDVRVERAGRMPFLLEWGKWCEVRDCEFDGARELGGGGTGYVGWQRATDCLMTDVVARGMRHAPIVQWAASGNVIRASRFEGSDMQWHAGWSNENLFEDCTVLSTREFGGYGYGGWASPPGDRQHGPNGPRNVVYNCDVHSPRAGLWLGGSNEAWLFAHNRFVVEHGAGVVVQNASFDHVLLDNVFVLRDPSRPLLLLRTADCVGMELCENRLAGGNGALVGGEGAAGVTLRGNVVEDRRPDAPVARPAPAVPSIFAWQRRRPR